MATERTPSPSSPPSECAADEILSALEPRDRLFVRALLRGETPSASAAIAGWRSHDAALMALGRPQVRDALLAIAPLLATDAEGERLARAILRPYAVARMAGLLNVKGQNGLAAARDLLDGDPGARSDAARLRRAAEERARSRGGAADKSRYGKLAASLPGDRVLPPAADIDDLPSA